MSVARSLQMIRKPQAPSPKPQTLSETFRTFQAEPVKTPKPQVKQVLWDLEVGRIREGTRLIPWSLPSGGRGNGVRLAQGVSFRFLGF